ncbi:MAG: hypothetical protein C4K58_06985 [Flavobacteriaceae bacterium]|nr:MAG: hypothetical protein C4K58_06985 [Flavobacteriaceae bacterium]
MKDELDHAGRIAKFIQDYGLIGGVMGFLGGSVTFLREGIFSWEHFLKVFSSSGIALIIGFALKGFGVDQNLIIAITGVSGMYSREVYEKGKEFLLAKANREIDELKTKDQ